MCVVGIFEGVWFCFFCFILFCFIKQRGRRISKFYRAPLLFPFSLPFSFPFLFPCPFTSHAKRHTHTYSDSTFPRSLARSSRLPRPDDVVAKNAAGRDFHLCRRLLRCWGLSGLVWLGEWFRGKGGLLVLRTRTSRDARTTLLTLRLGGMVEAADGWILIRSVIRR